MPWQQQAARLSSRDEMEEARSLVVKRRCWRGNAGRSENGNSYYVRGGKRLQCCCLRGITSHCPAAAAAAVCTPETTEILYDDQPASDSINTSTSLAIKPNYCVKLLLTLRFTANDRRIGYLWKCSYIRPWLHVKLNGCANVLFTQSLYNHDRGLVWASSRK